ncbi:enoyl-[acyl-carrier-protein] reductase FabI [Methylobacterium sp. DB1607]|nr:enoyl-[acyl-carrier-protein] reductase FabI [Methylobacterium sp. DB1607]
MRPILDGNALSGQRALVLGVADVNSIAYGCARAFHRLGADVALTYLNGKTRPFIEPLARALEAPLFMPCDLQRDGDLEAVFRQIAETWGGLDIVLHSIAFGPRQDLRGRLIDSSSEGFKVAMDVSCHSFIRTARLAAPLMPTGGTLLTMSYHGANRVVPNYNLMGPVKAALESAVRYLAYELGQQDIRVHAVSPGPLKTRAASGLKDFDLLLAEAMQRAPIGELVDIDDVGLTAAYMTTPYAAHLTGMTVYVDGGLSIMA